MCEKSPTSLHNGNLALVSIRLQKRVGLGWGGVGLRCHSGRVDFIYVTNFDKLKMPSGETRRVEQKKQKHNKA